MHKKTKKFFTMAKWRLIHPGKHNVIGAGVVGCGLSAGLDAADLLEAVQHGDPGGFGGFDLPGHARGRVGEAEDPQLVALEHQLTAETQGQLALGRDCVVNELREVDVRGDRDAAPHSCGSAVSLGPLDVVFVVPAAWGANINLFHRLQGSICGRLLARGADEMLRRRRWPLSALSARSPSFAPPAFAGQGDGSAHLAGVPFVNLACQGRVISSASHVVVSFLRSGGAGCSWLLCDAGRGFLASVLETLTQPLLGELCAVPFAEVKYQYI